MEMHQIRYFIAVAEERHISRAAERCHVSQPSLSRAIKKLEDELGAALFERKPGRVELTEFGRRIEPHLRQCVEKAASAKSAAVAFLTGRDREIRLGIMSGIFHPNLLTLIQRIESRFNDVEIKVRQGANDTLVTELLDDRLDIVITAAMCDGWASRTHSEPLYEERYVVIFPPDHRFAGRASVPLEDVLQERLLSGLANGYRTIEDLPGGTNGTGVPRPFITIESHCVMQAMIAAGAGCAIVPEYVPRQPGIMARPLSGASYSRKVKWLTARGRPHSPLMSHVARLMRSMDWSPKVPA